MNLAAATSAYQEAIEVMSRYLDQYPDGASAGDIRERRDRLTAELRALRAATDEYQATLKQELDESKPQLPSDCQRMAKLWQEYVNRFPQSRDADTARQKQARWDAKQKQEVQRGFQIVFEEAEVKPVKGPAHGLMAGRPWDPEIFAEHTPPDAYAGLLLNGEVKAYTMPAQDSYHPVWRKESDVLRVSDDQEVSIVVRDRDIAEKAAVLLMGKSLFSFSGMAAATAAFKQDNDDDICTWRGTIRELIEKGNKGFTNVDDCLKLRVRVIRPR